MAAWNRFWPRRLIVQFLEGGTVATAGSPQQAVALLDEAFARLPVTDLCVGWRLPPQLLDAVTQSVRMRSRAALWLWHPLLTGDGSEQLRDDDLTIGPAGEPIRDPSGGDAFTFVCPNRRQAFSSAIARLLSDMRSAAYDGVFLDRIRWPSPSAAPDRLLACFCGACVAAAATEGLDLRVVARDVSSLSETVDGRRQLIRALFGASVHEAIDRFLRWRASVIVRAVDRAVEHVADQRHGSRRHRIALDIFSPSLAWMVGQDLPSLAPQAEWMKAMVYSTVHAPAGLPFELGGILRWLSEGGDTDAAGLLSDLVGYPIVARVRRLPAEAVRVELTKLDRAVGERAAAGIEAVVLPGVVTMTLPMLLERLRVAAGMQQAIVLSWDLARTPPDWIRAVGEELSGVATRADRS